MSLLAPAGLATLLLLPVVLLIHLWRVRYRRHTLPSTLLWSRVLSESPLRRPRRLPTRYILLLLELAALLCGGLALARPAFVAAGTARHLLVAVDTSLLMTANDTRPNRLARARELVSPLIDGLAARDSMTLVDAGATPRALITSSDHAALCRALDALAPGDGPSSLAGDGALLAGLATAGGSHTATYLFAPLGTDDATLNALRGAVPGLRVRTVGTTNDDRAVAGLSVSCPAGQAPGSVNTSACEAYARLVNTASSPITTRVTASVDGQSVTRTMTLLANSSQPISLRLPANAHSVELRLDGRDALAADDAAWAVVPQVTRRDVLLVTSDSSSPLIPVLRAIPGVTLATDTPDDASLYNVAQRADLTVLDETGPDVLPPGNLIFVNPAVSPQSGNNALFSVVGDGTMVAPAVMGTDRASALLRAVDLNSLLVSAATRVALPAWARADITGDTGPLLFSGVTGGRRVAVLTFDPRPSATANSSNLDTLLAFPALLQNLVQNLAPAPQASATAGAVAALPLTRQSTATLAFAGNATGKETTLPSSGDLAALPASRPGLYTVNGTAGGANTLAVNVGAAGGATTNSDAASAPATPFPSVPVAPSPWEGWALFTVLALLFLGGEWWYYVRHT